MIGLLAVMIVLLLGLPFFLHQDWRREVRKHVREFPLLRPQAMSLPARRLVPRGALVPGMPNGPA